MIIQLVAKKAFSYAHRAMQPSDIFTASRQDAQVLVALRRATYQTADMVAAPVVEAPVEVVNTAVVKAKRTYTHRSRE